MIKNILYLILLLAILLTTSCTSSGKPDFKLDGKWHVYQRSFSCTDPSIQKRVNNILYPNYVSGGKQSYITFEYESASGEGNYKEELKELEYINGEDGDPIWVTAHSYGGTYAADYEKNTLGTTVTVADARIWQTTSRIGDLNNEFLYIQQTMNSEDLVTFLRLYFDSFETVDEGVTAVWATKALKE